MEHTTSRVDRVEPRPTLAGRVSRRLLLLLLIGDILGAGIYVLVGEVAAEAGAMMWLPFAVAFVIAMLSAVSYAELVTRYPGAAGSALYARRAFGSPTLTAVVGTAVLASTVTTSATTARAFAGDYLSAFVDLPEVVVAAGLIALLTVVATLGIETSARANATLTGVEAFGLLLVVAVGVAVLAGGEVDPRPLADPGPLTLGAVISATALAFFAFIGFEDAVHLSEEVDDPQRTFPMVMVAAVAVTGVIYLLIAVLSAMVVAPSVLAASDGPLLEVIHAGPLPIPDRVFAAIALGAVTNTSLFALVAAARLIYGMAADGDLPPALAATSNRGSPTRAAIL
ncbi:MAG: APC family permease, partial [Actinomycetota bacterium]